MAASSATVGGSEGYAENEERCSTIHQVQVTFDARDPRRLAAFWAEALGYIERPPPPGFATWEDFGRHVGLPEERWSDYVGLDDPDGVGPLFFQRVPEGKTGSSHLAGLCSHVVTLSGHMVGTCCDEVPGCAGDGGAPGGVGRCLAG